MNNGKQIIAQLAKLVEMGHEIQTVDFNTGVVIVCLGTPLEHGLTKEEREHLEAGRKIDAIRDIRSRAKVSLKEAKDMAEAYIAHLENTSS